MLKNGSLQHFKLTDIINILAQSGKTGKLNISSVKLNAILFFSGGKLVHAESDDNISGEDVVFELITSESGDFSFAEEEFSSPVTISKNTEELIHEASMHTEMLAMLEKKGIARDPNASLTVEKAGEQIISENELKLLDIVTKEGSIKINRFFPKSGLNLEKFVNAINSLLNNGIITLKKTEKETFWNSFQKVVNAFCDEFISISGHKMSNDLEKKIQDLIYTNAWNLSFKDGKIYSNELFSFPVNEQWKIYSIFFKNLLAYFSKIYGESFAEKVLGKLLITNPELEVFINKIKREIN